MLSLGEGFQRIPATCLRSRKVPKHPVHRRVRKAPQERQRVVEQDVRAPARGPGDKPSGRGRCAEDATCYYVGLARDMRVCDASEEDCVAGAVAVELQSDRAVAVAQACATGGDAAGAVVTNARHCGALALVHPGTGPACVTPGVFTITIILAILHQLCSSVRVAATSLRMPLGSGV